MEEEMLEEEMGEELETENEEIEAAARRLGHSPETFMNTYARHTSDKTENKLLERITEV